MTSYRSFFVLAVVVYLSVVVLFHTQLRLSGPGNDDDDDDETIDDTVRKLTPPWPPHHHPESSNLPLAPLHDHCASDVNSTVAFRSVGRHFVFSAYLDDRRRNNPTIRIIALLRNDGGTQPSFKCHVTSGGATDTRKWSISADLYEMCENHAKEYGGWILSCSLPNALAVLKSPCEVTVTTSGGRGEAATLPVYRLSNDTHRQRLAVCLPPLFGHVPSTTVVEFIEMSKLLGVDHVIVYLVAQLASEVVKTLNYYVELGVVTLIDWNLPIDDKFIWYRGQLVAINDCLYRSMHAFDLLSFNDIDEFIVPHKHRSIPDMVDSLQRTPLNATTTQYYCGYSFQSTFFDPMLSGPSTHVLYDLESDLRTKTFSKVRTKVIVHPSAVFEVGIHHVSRPFVDQTSLNRTGVLNVDTDAGYVHHYRKCSSEFDYKMNCQVFVRDEGLSTFIPSLRHSVHNTLWTLKDRHDQKLYGSTAAPLPVRQ